MKTLIIIIPLVAICTFAFQPVDLNHASIEQIALLPGVGKKLADNIVAYRKKHGPLSFVDELKNIPGMTEKKLDGLKNHIVFMHSVQQSKKNEQKIPQKKIFLLQKKSLITLPVLETKVLSVQGLDKEFDDSLRHRARISSYLPKLLTSFGVDHGASTTEKMEKNKDSLLRRGDRDFGVDIRVVFDLDKLIFNKDELEIAKLSLKRLEKREEVIRTLHKNYFRYIHLAEILEGPVDITVGQIHFNEMNEIEAMLDSMSNGEFTRYQIKHIPVQEKA